MMLTEVQIENIAKVLNVGIAAYVAFFGSAGLYFTYNFMSYFGIVNGLWYIFSILSVSILLIDYRIWSKESLSEIIRRVIVIMSEQEMKPDLNQNIH